MQPHPTLHLSQRDNRYPKPAATDYDGDRKHGIGNSDPFQGDRGNENPEDFLQAFFRGLEIAPTTSKQFPNYLKADSVADDWFMNLDRGRKEKLGRDRDRIPEKVAKEEASEENEEIINWKLKEKVAGRDIYSHIVWADKWQWQ